MEEDKFSLYLNNEIKKDRGDIFIYEKRDIDYFLILVPKNKIGTPNTAIESLRAQIKEAKNHGGEGYCKRIQKPFAR